MCHKLKKLNGLIWMLLGLSSIHIGCEKNIQRSENPQGRLTSYISESFNVQSTSDKTKLLEFLTGDVKSRLERWSDDQFRENFLDTKRKFLKLSFREVKEVSAKEVQITYELVFTEGPSKLRKDNQGESKMTQKKLCQMVYKSGKWYISSVKNIKELVEYEDALSLP